MEPDPPVDQSPRTGRSRLRHPVGTIVAAVISAAVFVLAVTSGDAPADDTGVGVDTNGITPDAKPKFGYPFCRVDVTELADGYHVAVTLLNDLPTVWAVVDNGALDVTVPVSLVRGMGQVALPTNREPQRVTIFGTEQLLGLSAGCTWTPG